MTQTRGPCGSRRRSFQFGTTMNTPTMRTGTAQRCDAADSLLARTLLQVCGRQQGCYMAAERRVIMPGAMYTPACVKCCSHGALADADLLLLACCRRTTRRRRATGTCAASSACRVGASQLLHACNVVNIVNRGCPVASFAEGGQQVHDAAEQREHHCPAASALHSAC
jgi:hypothetical protein